MTSPEPTPELHAAAFIAYDKNGGWVDPMFAVKAVVDLAYRAGWDAREAALRQMQDGVNETLGRRMRALTEGKAECRACSCVTGMIDVGNGPAQHWVPGRTERDPDCPIHGRPAGCTCPVIDNHRLGSRSPGPLMLGLDPDCPQHTKEGE